MPGYATLCELLLRRRRLPAPQKRRGADFGETDRPAPVTAFAITATGTPHRYLDRTCSNNGRQCRRSGVLSLVGASSESGAGFSQCTPRRLSPLRGRGEEDRRRSEVTSRREHVWTPRNASCRGRAELLSYQRRTSSPREVARSGHLRWRHVGRRASALSASGPLLRSL